VSSIAAACVEAGVALLGGETAEHPGVMAPDAFDLSGAALGVVERGREITGAAIAPGDAIVGLDSPNLRANGFSLIRKALSDRVDLDAELPGTGRRAADVLLERSVLYAPAIGVLRTAVPVHGLAHITGGGLPGNVARVLPIGCRAVIDAAAWQPAPVFPAVRRLVGGAEEELFRTFNMGIGFVAVVPPDAADEAVAVLEDEGRSAQVIGRVTAGDRAVELLHPAR
jgi:phosphoribosylformylglycinamidine cyclo-ligase